MRSAIALLAMATASLAVAACGGGESAGGSLDTALRYLPADASQVIVASTDLDDDQWQALGSQLQRGELAPEPDIDLDDQPEEDAEPPPESIEDLLREDLAHEDISYDDEVKPLLGGDLVLGILGAPGVALDDLGEGFVAALDTGDGEATRSLLEALGLREQGETSGAAVFGDAGDEAFVALDGDVLVVAVAQEGDEGAAIADAVSRARGEDQLTDESLDEALAGLPEDALVRLYVNPRSLLGAMEAERLLELPWFAALESVGATAGFDDDALHLDAVARTDDPALTEEDLPLPAGAPTPELVRQEGEIAGASANQSQTTTFLLDAVRVAFPDSRFVRDVEKLEDALNLDFEREFLRQFDGPSASSLSPSDVFSARSQIQDPERMANALRKLAPDIGRLVQDLQSLQGRGLIPLFLFAPDAPIAPGVLGGSRIDVSRISGEPDLYRISNLFPAHLEPFTPLPRQIVFGVIEGVFVVASDLERAKAIVDAPSDPPPSGLEGASIAVGNVGPLRDRVRGLLGIDPGPLGELTAALEASTSEVRGMARIEFR